MWVCLVWRGSLILLSNTCWPWVWQTPWNEPCSQVNRGLMAWKLSWAQIHLIRLVCDTTSTVLFRIPGIETTFPCYAMPLVYVSPPRTAFFCYTSECYLSVCQYVSLDR